MSDSKGAAIRDEIAGLINDEYGQYIDYDSYVVDLSQAEEVADKILALLAQEVNKAREAELQRLYDQADAHGIVRTTKSALYKRMMKLDRKAGLV